MRICAAWLLMHVASCRRMLNEKLLVFMSGQCSLTRISRLRGRDFLVPTRLFTLAAWMLLPPGAMRRNELWRMRRSCSQTLPKPCSPWVITNIGCCEITGSPNVCWPSSAKCYRAAAEYEGPRPNHPNRRDTGIKSIAYFEQALALDPRNVELLGRAAYTHGMLRQFEAALKLNDRRLDITPSDPDVIALTVSIYQVQGQPARSR